MIGIAKSQRALLKNKKQSAEKKFKVDHRNSMGEEDHVNTRKIVGKKMVKSSPDLKGKKGSICRRGKTPRSRRIRTPIKISGRGMK